MKFRVRLDMSFDSETDAQALLTVAKKASKKATSINEGTDNEEISFYSIEKCRHDEGLPCDKPVKVEIRTLMKTLP